MFTFMSYYIFSCLIFLIYGFIIGKYHERQRQKYLDWDDIPEPKTKPNLTIAPLLPNNKYPDTSVHLLLDKRSMPTNCQFSKTCADSLDKGIKTFCDCLLDPPPPVDPMSKNIQDVLGCDSSCEKYQEDGSFGCCDCLLDIKPKKEGSYQSC